MDSEIILETQNLEYFYHKDDLALRDVSIKIPKGKKTILLGANGTGKSTLFLHFNGVLKPKKGKVLYNGQEITYSAKALSELRSKVAVVLQNPDDQIFSTTVEEDVAFGPLNMGLPREEVEKRVEEALFLVNMTEYRSRPSQQLSFGQRKRVAFAGALAMKPEVLIMDEPTAGLDPQMTHELMELTDELVHLGTTVIISTHDVAMAYTWAEELHVLQNGRLVFSGKSEEFFTDPVRVHLAGLSQPVLFEINAHLESLGKGQQQPYPRNITQFISKLAPSATAPGTLHLLPVNGKLEQETIDAIIRKCNNGKARVGISGTGARIAGSGGMISADYVFNSIENCLTETILGLDAIICYDECLEGIIREKLANLMDNFGMNIKVVKEENPAQ